MPLIPLIALGSGLAGAMALSQSGLIGGSESSDERRPPTMTEGIPQARARTSRGFGVPQTKKSVSKRNVTINEGDTNIKEITEIDGSSGTKKDSGSSSSSSSSSATIRDDDSGAVIRDASPDNNSDSKPKKEDDSDDGGSSTSPVYSV